MLPALLALLGFGIVVQRQVRHLFAGRTTLDAFPASQFIGKALVIECSDLNEGEAITLERILQPG